MASLMDDTVMNYLEGRLKRSYTVYEADEDAEYVSL